jgi:protein-S-isoprenylcysteine O-methyltransferase Ste14
MNFSLPMTWFDFCWLVFILYWLVSAFNRKATKKHEGYIGRLGYMLVMIVSFWFLYRPETGRYPILGLDFIPPTLAWRWAAVAITAAGVALAIWARRSLGSNWSGVVTLKEGHELIRKGPYRSIRHPIYTGILIALLGTAVMIGEVRGLLAVVACLLSFYIKARREESFLSQEFGPAFAEHRRHTGMFLPKLFHSRQAESV